MAAWLEEHAMPLRVELGRRGIAALQVFPEAARARDSFSIETLGKEATD